jgi:uncharacterized protein YlxW (UPF0749 family)
VLSVEVVMTAARRRSATVWRAVVPVVAVLAGLTFAMSGVAARGTDLRGGRSTRLADLIGTVEQGNARRARDVSALHDQVGALTAKSRDASVEGAQAEAQRLSPPAGLTAVTGPGLTIALNDAPAGAIDRAYPGLPTPSPDDLVVHQQDVQAVVNALWAGGADAIQLMDQRVISTSAVRCVGNTLILQGRVYSPPYTITAIGDTDRLFGALSRSTAVHHYRQYAAAYGLGYQLGTRSDVTIPAYTGALDLRYATPAGD